MLKQTLQEVRAGLHFSASALKTFLQCPWKFRLRYVDGAQPEFQPSALILGKAVHAALAEHHLCLMKGSTSTPDATLTRFDENLDRATDVESEINYKNGEDLDTLGCSVAFDTGAAIIGASRDGYSRQGSAYLFSSPGCAWTEQDKLLASDGAGEDSFGYGVALDGDT